MTTNFVNAHKGHRSKARQAAFAGLHSRDSSISLVGRFRHFGRGIGALTRVLLNSEVRKYLAKGWTETTMIRALRRYCDKQNCYLAVQPRKDIHRCLAD